MKSVSGAQGLAQDRPISRASLVRLLRDLEVHEPSNAITLYTKTGHFREQLPEFQPGSWEGLKTLTELSSRTEKSATGAAVFWCEDKGLAILPPFPVEADEVMGGWDVSRLRALLDRDYVVGLVLLRLGRYAVGVFRGQVLLASKTGTRYVKGRHSAGGQSQKRFQRIREKQVQEIFHKACSVVEHQFAPFEDALDYILLGGERFTLQGLVKECDYLKRLSPKILGRVLDVRVPTHVALEAAIEKVWESRLVSIGQWSDRDDSI